LAPARTEATERERIQYGALKAVADGIEAEYGESHGYGYHTLKECVLFAKRTPETELENVVLQFRTWHNIAANGNGAHVAHNAGESVGADGCLSGRRS
jgi:hypothetical protein